MKLNYLAYGSNLHPLRLSKRVPSAALAATVELPARSLSFSKRSRDGSGKCTIAEAGAGQSVFAAIFRIDSQDKPLLDRIEGLGAGYDEHWEDLDINGEPARAFAYIADRGYLDKALQPYGWYRDLVLEGARYHRFPAHYIAALEAVKAVGDPDGERRMTNEAILAEMLS